MATALFGLGACNEPPLSRQDDAIPSVENIDQQPDRFVGQRVSLSGDVGKVHSNQAFELEEPGWNLGNEVLVLTRTPVRLGGKVLTEDTKVKVSGTVRKLVVADVERELGWDLDKQIEITWDAKPVVIADSISAMRSYADWSEKDAPKGALVSLWAFYSVPHLEELEGSDVELDRAEVTYKGESGFWVGVDGSSSLYVMPDDPNQLAAVLPGCEVDIEGSVARVPVAAERPATWNLSEEEQKRIADDLLYVRADEVTVIAPDKLTGGNAEHARTQRRNAAGMRID